MTPEDGILYTSFNISLQGTDKESNVCSFGLVVQSRLILLDSNPFV